MLRVEAAHQFQLPRGENLNARKSQSPLYAVRHVLYREMEVIMVAGSSCEAGRQSTGTISHKSIIICACSCSFTPTCERYRNLHPRQLFSKR